eukprot:CAMPEP_0197456188 /NCGR_PEP_ID=MMETSP1175-20131217/42718_1 /TAXON_ID=1003142 /ORGANISM="Triceratium dubium, Strain CCMP147" /LENGTH=366 /DNA_ID=CAMNT_0042990221 /DNA_START=68 /DNA_END=1168 /DNA_ORIENTATION=+
MDNEALDGSGYGRKGQKQATEGGFVEDNSEHQPLNCGPINENGDVVENESDSDVIDGRRIIEDDKSGVVPISCIARIRYELRSSPFHTREPCGRYIDIRKTFCPEPVRSVLLVRISFFLIMLEILIQNLLATSPDARWFFMAYLTHWGLVVALAYQLSALAGMVLRRTVMVQTQDGNDKCNILLLISWALFAVALPAEVILSVLYWALVHEQGDPVSYQIVMLHGGISVLLLIDGFFVGSVPLRIKQVLFLMVFCVCYLLWTVVFAESDIRNPDKANNDDAIYDALEWNRNPEGSAILSAMCAFVVPPIVFSSFWALSLATRRIYQRDVGGGGGSGSGMQNNGGVISNDDDVEELSASLVPAQQMM